MMLLLLFFVSLCSEFERELDKPDPDLCLYQDMNLQLRSSTSAHAPLSKLFKSENRLKWCPQQRELHVYSHGVEKYSFTLRFQAQQPKGRWRGYGQCTSGRKVKVDFKVQGTEINWVRIMYPNYRFLHIFARDADQMKDAVGENAFSEAVVSSNFYRRIR